MRVLFFGDVFSKPGRIALKAALRKLVPEHLPDFIIVNGENVAHGKGINESILRELFDLGIDAVTTGNHAWDQVDSIQLYQREPRLLRAANYGNYIQGSSPHVPLVPGRGSVVLTCQSKPRLKLGLVLLMGRVFMDSLECPFHFGKMEVDKLKAQGIKSILVDFHAEASSEKQAFAHFMDGEVSAVLGTHSHVQTADERILSKGTATITDVGMTGCFDSVIGMKKEIVIKKFITKMPQRFEPAEGVGGYGAVLVDIDEETGKATSIQRFREETIHEAKWI